MKLAQFFKGLIWTWKIKGQLVVRATFAQPSENGIDFIPSVRYGDTNIVLIIDLPRWGFKTAAVMQIVKGWGLCAVITSKSRSLCFKYGCFSARDRSSPHISKTFSLATDWCVFCYCTGWSACKNLLRSRYYGGVRLFNINWTCWL